jgi:hypothetical protein
MIGIPALSILPSSISDDIKRILSVFKVLYVVVDNDEAGTKLYKEMSSIFPFVYRVTIPPEHAKDLDEFATQQNTYNFVKQFRLNAHVVLKGDQTNECRSRSFKTIKREARSRRIQSL